MKHNGLYIFLGCCVLAFAMVIGAHVIANNLPDTTHVPSSLSVYSRSEDEQGYFGDYLSVYEAAVYLQTSHEVITDLIESGELDTAYFKMGDDYVISKQALKKWADAKLTEEKPPVYTTEY